MTLTLLEVEKNDSNGISKSLHNFKIQMDFFQEIFFIITQSLQYWHS